MRTRVRLASIFGLGLLLPSCTSVVGVGVVAVVTGAAVLASDCSDFIDVTVRDGVTGGRTCAATVTVARSGEEEEPLMPCYHARLGEGVWQMRARMPGRNDAVSTLKIERPEKCGRTVQSVELWLQPLGAAPAATPLQPSPPPLPVPPPAPPSVQTAVPAQTAVPPAPVQTAVPAPPANTGPKASPPPSGRAPPGSAVGPGAPTNNGPVKRFPDAAPRGK